MYQAYPHAPQPSFHPAHLAPVPYYPAPQAPSAARTSPVLGVLVAMALMALLGAAFAVSGVVIGAVAFAPSDAASPVTPTAQLLHNNRM